MTSERTPAPRLAATTDVPFTSRLTKAPATLLLALFGLLTLAACTPPDDTGNPPPPPPAGDVVFVQRASGLTNPTAMAHAGDDRLFVAELAGTVRIIQDGQLLAEPFLDLTGTVALGGGEQGLSGIAFPPDHNETGRFYAYYTKSATVAVLSRFTLDPTNPNRIDPASLEELVEVPDTDSEYHFGGQLPFGPDGYLYWAVGDGGVGSNAQSLSSLRGKILRLDVSPSTGYTSPPDNPFVDDAGALDEIWAYGLRNPWRFSFDRQTEELYIADVGERDFEEVNVAPAGVGGQNFGWPYMEGPECLTGVTCDPANYTAPAFSYAHPAEGSASITGGYVYRGPAAPDLEGKYVFGDFMQESVSVAELGANWEVTELRSGNWRTASFGEGPDGRLYVTDFGGGIVNEILQEEE